MGTRIFDRVGSRVRAGFQGLAGVSTSAVEYLKGIRVSPRRFLPGFVGRSAFGILNPSALLPFF